jgi:uncharacterized membrane protein
LFTSTARIAVAHQVGLKKVILAPAALSQNPSAAAAYARTGNLGERDVRFRGESVSAMSKRQHSQREVSSSAERLIAGNVRRIADLEESVRAKGTLSDQIAAGISRFCGSMIFVWVHAVIFAAWILLNTVLLPKPFDPYPFTFLTLVVSLEAIFLSTFIMIAENRQERISERRGQLDLQINMLAEQEGTKTLQILNAIASKLDVDVSGDPTIGVLEEATQPEQLARQIDRSDANAEKNGSK